MRARLIVSLMCVVGCGSALRAQLTTDQKLLEFQSLVSIYAKNYAPYEWKREVKGFDLMDAAPWLAKVRATRSDLEFYDLMSEYVSRLDDAHDAYLIPSNFAASLNFSVDIYDGSLLVDSINRTRLPANEFPFLVGYELVSIDGVQAEQLLDRLLRYSVGANPRSTRRLAAELLTFRPQQLIATAGEVPEISTVVFRKPFGGPVTFRIPWTRRGVPITSIGRSPSSNVSRSASTPAQAAGSDDASPIGDDPEDETPEYLKVLRTLQQCRVPDRGVVGFGSRFPVFLQSLPNFSLRIGSLPTDTFLSGIMEYSGYRIGFVRIPNFSPPNQTAAVNAFLREILFLQANTDGLVVDVMRNPGGSVSYTNTLLSLLIPYKWNSVAFEVRATSAWVASISSSIEQAKAQMAPQQIIDQLTAIKDAIVTANREQRGRTIPIPLDGVTIDREPLLDNARNPIAYSKPLMVLIDEMTASGGDVFAATIQDNDRGLLFGWRTMGAGGSVSGSSAGAFSQGFTTYTQSLMYRPREVVTPDFPPTRYVENVGVRPDIQADYMTGGNLVANGLDFVALFVNAMIQHIQTSK